MKNYALPLLICGIMTVANIATADTQPAVAQTPASLQRYLKQIERHGKANNLQALSRTLDSLTTDPEFQQLDPNFQQALYIHAADILSHQSQYEKAYSTILKAGEMGDSTLDAEYWHLRASIALNLKKTPEAVDAFTQLAQQFPEALKALNAGEVFSFARLSFDLGDVASLNLLEALRAANYDPGGAGTAESYWFKLIELYVQRGEIDKAKNVAESIKTTYSLIQLKIDKRYSDLRQITDADITASLKYDLDRYDKARLDNPQKLAGYDNLASLLGDQGRSEEGLALLNEAQSKIDKASKGQPIFTDLKDTYSWVLNTRAGLLIQLGRDHEAETAIRLAYENSKNEHTSRNGHILNLANFYNGKDRPKDALKLINNIDKKFISKHGVMVHAKAYVCAYSQLNDAETVDKAVEWIMDPERLKFGYRLAEDALLCAGKGDEFAKLIIGRLENPKTRNSALMGLQTYLYTPWKTQRGQAMTDLWKRTIAREDVQYAVNRYGAIYSFPIRTPMY